MSLSDLERLAETVQRGRLTSDEEEHLRAFLREHPEHRAVFEEDCGLNHLLQQLPDAPVSTNFTAGVLQAVRQNREPARSAEHGAFWQKFLRQWMPAAATAVLAVGLAVAGYQQHQMAKRQEMARNLAEFSKDSSGASVEFLQHFEAIQRLGQVPQNVDRELLAALQ